MAGTRLCLGAEVCGGKDSAAKHGLPGLWELLDALPRTHWPAFLRGDCGYGNEALMTQAEERAVPYLFKLRHTVRVSLQHEKSALIRDAITLVSSLLARISAIAQQWTIEERWTLLLTYVLRHWLGGKWLGRLPPEAAGLLSG